MYMAIGFISLIGVVVAPILVALKVPKYSKGRGFKMALSSVICLIIFIIAVASSPITPTPEPVEKAQTETPAAVEKTPEVATPKPVPTEAPTPKAVEPTPVPTEITLTSGLYVAGEDFPEGKYDIIAISGDGNVYSSNMFSGGLNQIMSSSPEEGFSIKEYKNAKLTKGVELTVSSVKIKLIKKGD